ncbi:ion transporter [Idiomarina sp. OT37-5b]|uniref:Ion transporter n=1 Tax=Idiomarina aquatica TaxID=1327752 RepID=A0AA94JEP6_9GAMM|nr:MULTISPECIES: potassium channel family protein [Idiomarina]AVJ55016.1 ion transporter [Idiomarina sp. OT37-5b]RUO45450.1 ion transporter [Idiomarina aquatica]
MIISFLANSLVVLLVVAFHYEALRQIGLVFHKWRVLAQFRIGIAVLLALIVHSCEAAIFALAYYFMHHHPDFGTLHGAFDGSFLDSLYFSFTVYTTVGFGDIYPQGELRFLTGIESLTGLVLITWTASFLYVKMTRYWTDL